MYKFIPEKDASKGSLITFFQLKKTAVENNRLSVEACGEHALTQKLVNDYLNDLKVVILI